MEIKKQNSFYNEFMTSAEEVYKEMVPETWIVEKELQALLKSKNKGENLKDYLELEDHKNSDPLWK